MSALKVGVTLPQFSSDAGAFAATARRVEDLELDSAFLFDHMWPLTGKGARPVLESWTSLAYVAAATRTISVGTLVTRSTLRHPALLATMAATVADVAPDRLIVGIGSGDELSRNENVAFGFPYFEGAMRTEQLRATLRAMTAAWDDGRVDVSDDSVRITGLPVRRPRGGRPRLWVGGRSAAAFRLAASFADAWNTWMAPPATMRTALERLRARRGESAEVTWGAAVVIGRDDDAAQAALRGRPASRYVVGSPRTVAAQLDELRVAGVAHVVLTPAAGATQEAYELIAETRRLLVL